MDSNFREVSTTLKCPTSRGTDQINFFYVCHFLCVVKGFEVVMRTLHTERANVYFSSNLLELLLCQLFRLSGENQARPWLGCSSKSPSGLGETKGFGGGRSAESIDRPVGMDQPRLVVVVATYVL